MIKFWTNVKKFSGLSGTFSSVLFRIRSAFKTGTKVVLTASTFPEKLCKGM